MLKKEIGKRLYDQQIQDFETLIALERCCSSTRQFKGLKPLVHRAIFEKLKEQSYILENCLFLNSKIKIFDNSGI